ncbi:MAG: type II toxin-antitoxin system VapC family toxin [Acidimicrobiales bacterium]
MLVDSGPLVAAAHDRERRHRECVSLLETATRPLLVPELVMAEVAYLVGGRVGAYAEAALAQSIADGEIALVPTEPPDWERIAELIEHYLDLPLGLVDAAVVAIAERLGETTIATLDDRDFSVVRPRHIEAFELVP